ncbi:MAG: M23 family metallopeptidase [Planctomycetaceae bacterium]|nr:M23 family metallopeptidase [Planctomycetaceae bacterium]
MKKIIFTTLFIFLILVIFSNKVFSQNLANVAPPDNFAKASTISSLPQVLLWHFNLLVLAPEYYEELNAAKLEKYDKLKAGETVNFLIIGDQVGDARFFKYLLQEGVPRLDNYKVLGKVTISKPRYTSNVPMLPPLSKDDFGRVKKLVDMPELTYEDHLFATKAINALRGVRGKDIFIDLLDPTARAIADGTVILVARKGERNFQVFDIDTNKADIKKYSKGKFVESLGNTVWLYSKIDGREYTTIYAHLDNLQTSLGAKVIQAETIIGKWQNEKQNISIWRTHGKQQRFLRNEPYCIMPITIKDNNKK